VLFPGRRLVAIYGHPGDPNLGVLGEQGVEAAVQRARDVAAGYAGMAPEPVDLEPGIAPEPGDTEPGVVADPVIPTFEIITTVASSDAGPDGDYSAESPIEHIRPWVDAAAAAGIYVVLDLQPGYTDFLTQAKRYEELLVQPHVGLGLDPEWRLAPGERHMEDIGQVSAAEVNAVSAWLAELTRSRGLPQKMLLLHQFRLDMLPDRDAVQLFPELATVVQMDGLGTQEEKSNTWSAITAGGPVGAFFGWKNFYDEDLPMLSPLETVSIAPSPVFISYQ